MLQEHLFKAGEMGIKGEILLRDNQYSWETLIFLWFIVTDIEQNSLYLTYIYREHYDRHNQTVYHIHTLSEKAVKVLSNLTLSWTLWVKDAHTEFVWLGLVWSAQLTFTFTFMHLADAFIQSDLHCIQVTVLPLISSCFPWESNPWSWRC